MTAIQCNLPLSLIIRNKRVRKVGFPPLEVTANREADETCDRKQGVEHTTGYKFPLLSSTRAGVACSDVFGRNLVIYTHPL
jgi:hypothetical protein